LLKGSKLKKTVSLVLGSGGARGYAHIGVIEEILKNGYEIKSISGSSMGALIGGFYACGKLDLYKDWVLGLSFLDIAALLDVTFTKSGLIEGDKVFKKMEDMIGEVLIEDLPISFTAVATDLSKKKEVWFQKGSLIEAIRASSAIPTVLTPKKIENRYFIDGGVINPLPIAPTISDNTDFTIAVSLNASSQKEYKLKIPKKQEDRKHKLKSMFLDIKKKSNLWFKTHEKDTFDKMGIFEIMGKSIDIMQNTILESKMAGYKPDLLIGIPTDICGFYEFNRAYEMIELGRTIANEKLKNLQKRVNE
jgi:NTE family protein